MLFEPLLRLRQIHLLDDLLTKAGETYDAQGEKPYELTVAMSYPHGTVEKFSATALSNYGKYVFRVSNDDKPFRVWRRVSFESTGESDNKTPACQYKISSPSGYSNMETGHSAAAFSTDDFILAIGYGSIITLYRVRGCCKYAQGTQHVFLTKAGETYDGKVYASRVVASAMTS